MRLIGDFFWTIIMPEYKFINQPGLWMLDLIELHDSPYTEINFQTGFIFFGYQPANHLIYVQFIKSKDAESTQLAAQEMNEYLESQESKI